MSSIQHRVSDYLQQDLYHSIGAYGVADKGLADLVDRLEQSRPSKGSGGDMAESTTEKLLRLSRFAQRYNERLASQRHRPSDEMRHPIPEDLPLSDVKRFFSAIDGAKAEPEADEKDNSWGVSKDWDWVPDFYVAALQALDTQDAVEAGGSEAGLQEGECKWFSYTFASNLIFPRDGSALPLDLSPAPGGAREDVREKRRLLRDRRRKRYIERFHQSHRHLAGPPLIDGASPPSVTPIDPTQTGWRNIDELIRTIARSSLDTDKSPSASAALPTFVLDAHAEAHLSMHAVEAWQSMCLGWHANLAAPQTLWLEQELDRCIVLNTFAYGISRAAPWIFAQDEDESADVFRDIPTAWRRAVPTRCMWIASQVSLLALHRRAYAHGLKGKPIEAYNDYHKLQRLIRDTERRVESAPIHVDGALEFLGGLYAQAHHHIGELYRSELAQKPALKHFTVATHRLGRLREDGKSQGKDVVEQVLVNSRWRVQLYVSSGKANYELGRHKESLRCHLEAWRSLLCLLAADTSTEASTGEIDDAIAWLEDVRFEPELRKHEVQTRLRPVIDQLDGIVVDRRLATLAAEILLRLGHLLFVLNIMPRQMMQGPGCDRAESELSDPKKAEEAIRDTLALGCLRKALQCDPHCTLVGADLLKAEFRTHNQLSLPYSTVEKGRPRQQMNSIDRQWPGGGDDYERLARATEYLILRAHSEQSRDSEAADGNSSHDEQNEAIAQRLLLNFFTHTDSMNVRKSQAHRFLMRNTLHDPRPDEPTIDPGPAIELVCMRRYSSAFPLLPRPSAFRALGGGYLVRLHDTAAAGGERKRPFGIVMDPGADFVENLYRSGCSLSDVNMIVVTHDHVDHMGALDPLMSLLHERSSLLREQGEPDSSQRLTLIVNEAVEARYSRVEIVSGERGHYFRTFAELASGALDLGAVEGFPAGFDIVAASTAVMDGRGHTDLSEKPSHGVCFKAPDGISVAITGDTPRPPRPSEGLRPDRYGWWRATWAPILDADVLIAHLSTVPLTELRQLAGIDATDERMRPADVQAIQIRANHLCTSIRALATDMAGYTTAPDVEQVLTEIDTHTQELIERIAQSNGGSGRATIEEAAAQLRDSAGELQDVLAARTSPPTDSDDFRRAIIEAERLALDARQASTDASELESIRRRLEEESRLLQMETGNERRSLQGRIEFALWLRSKNRPTATLLGRVGPDWMPPQDHAYLTGLIAWAREYREARRAGKRPGLFIVGELSEELGTLRRQVAVRLNETVFDVGDGARRAEDGPIHAMTSDIGLRLFVSDGHEGAATTNRARVLCTNCNLDRDRVPDERYHAPHLIREVCVKGENEGIFYNCFEHDPSSQDDHTFLEQLERFDVFGR